MTMQWDDKYEWPEDYVDYYPNVIVDKVPPSPPKKNPMKYPIALYSMELLASSHPFRDPQKFYAFANKPANWVCRAIGFQANGSSVWEVRPSAANSDYNQSGQCYRWYYSLYGEQVIKKWGNKQSPIPVPPLPACDLLSAAVQAWTSIYGKGPDKIPSWMGPWEATKDDDGTFYPIVQAKGLDLLSAAIKAASESEVPKWAQVKINTSNWKDLSKSIAKTKIAFENLGKAWNKSNDLLSMAVDIAQILYSGDPIPVLVLPADHPYNADQFKGIALDPHNWEAAFVGQAGRVSVWKVRKTHHKSTLSGWQQHAFKADGTLTLDYDKSLLVDPPKKKVLPSDYYKGYSYPETPWLPKIKEVKPFYCESCCQDVEEVQCGNCCYCPECCGCEEGQTESRGTSTVPPWEKRGIKVDVSKIKRIDGDEDEGLRQQVWKAWGISPKDFSPTETFCDFYLLESMASQVGLAPDQRSEHTKFLADEAREHLNALIVEADGQLTGYMRMAMWGEARHHIALGGPLTSNRWTAWLRGAQMEKEIGPECYKDLAELFLEINDRSVGGKMWATASNLLAERMSGKLTGLVWVDRILTLIHNGGSLFNKVVWRSPVLRVESQGFNQIAVIWNVEYIPQVLGPSQADACTFWPMLLIGASDEVRNLWWRWERERNRARRDWALPPIMSERPWVNRLKIPDFFSHRESLQEQYRKERSNQAGTDQQVPPSEAELEKEAV